MWRDGTRRRSAEEAARAVDPLGVAVFNNDEKIVQLLLDRGLEAIGGPHVLHWAMGGAIQTGRAGSWRSSSQSKVKIGRSTGPQVPTAGPCPCFTSPPGSAALPR